MSTNPDVVSTIDMGAACTVCGGPTDFVVELPNLPLTDTFTRVPLDRPVPSFDQALRFCSACQHGQLAVQVSPKVLYGGDYGFRTSASATARRGTDFFLGMLERVATGRTFKMALDLGCNDLFLLTHLQGRAALRVGVDPLWAGRENEVDEPGIQVIGQGIEAVDLTDLEQKPDLVVCRHTLEHIARPLDVVKRMVAAAADDALFVFEVPGFEPLVNRNRFDQVFHQHLQYFTQASFARLLAQAGAKPIAWASNYHDWGAFAVAFVKGKGDGVAHEVAPPKLERVNDSLKSFTTQMDCTRRALDAMDGPVYGYGAAQMLPVLAYHLQSDLACLEAVLDDDPEKDGVLYANLPLHVRPSGFVGDLSQTSILITAVDSAQPILRHLLSGPRPRHIVYPFHII